MRAFHVLVLMLLVAMTSTVQAQVLHRRRVGHAVATRIAEFGANVTMEALNQGMNKAFDELGDVLVLQLAFQFYAQIEMDPQARQQFAGGAKSDSPNQSCVCMLLAESDRLTDRLKEEEFSPPVLEKMYLEYSGIDSTQAARNSGWSSRKLYAGEPPKKGEDVSNRPSVTLVERYLPKDPRSKSPQSVHCSLVFQTRKGQEFHKTVDFDIVLDTAKICLPVEDQERGVRPGNAGGIAQLSEGQKSHLPMVQLEWNDRSDGHANTSRDGC